MNINELNRIKYINIDEHMSGVEYGEGSLKQIIDMVYDEKIIPIINKEGEIVGISVNSGANNIIEDNIAQVKFEKAYCCKPVMEWVIKALDYKAARKIISEVVEDENGLRVIFDNGECDILCERTARSPYEHTEPDCNGIEIPLDELGDFEDDDAEYNAIARWLRDTYDRYLSGNANPQFIYEYDEDEGVYLVNEVKWGRKR